MQIENNMVSISFETVYEMPENGRIEIKTPIWTEIYDKDAQDFKQLYPMGDDDTSCQFTRGRFGSVDVSQSTEQTFVVVYTGLTNTNGITIKCSPWRNPVLPENHFGYQISVFDDQGILIDESEPFSLDATRFDLQSIDSSTFIYELSEVLTRKKSDYGLEFRSPAPIPPNNQCVVSITFPPELDISEVDASQVFGDGMLMG